MSELTEAIAETIRRRAVSTTFGTYLFFWVAYHWQGIYVTLFVNQDLILDKYGSLKNEYVNKYFFGLNNVLDWHFYLGFIIPALLTYIFIWHIPRLILEKAYRQEQRHRVRRRIIKAEEELNLQEAEESLAKQEKQTIQAEIDVVEKKNEARKIDPKIVWEEEFKSLNSFEDNLLSEILECIYKYRGNVQVDGEYAMSGPEFELSPNALRFADSKGLVNIIDKGTRIELTVKGKFYASKYQGKI